MSYDPANDARLRREEARRQEQFRETGRLQRERQFADERKRSETFYKKLREVRQTSANPVGLNLASPMRNVGTRRDGTSSTRGGDSVFDGLWKLISIISGLVAAFLIWRHIYDGNPAQPFIALGAGALSGWVTMRVVDSEPVRALARLASYATIVVGALWLLFHHN